MAAGEVAAVWAAAVVAGSSGGGEDRGDSGGDRGGSEASGVQQVEDGLIGGAAAAVDPFRRSLNVWGGVREIFC